MRELDLQKRIVDEIREAGGWARKWASPLQAGVPDLIMKLPDTPTMFAEVKLEIRTTFVGAKVKTTTLQKVELERIHKAGAPAFVLIGVVTPDCGRLYRVHRHAMMVEAGDEYTEWKRNKITLNVARLLSGYRH